MSAAELNPCPFCSYNMDGFVADPDGCAKCEGKLSIHCYNCNATGPEGYTVDEAIAAWNRRAQPASKSLSDDWISVKDRLPNPEIDVLVRCVHRISVRHDVAGLFHGEWASQVTGEAPKGDVTHWMLLPAPPEDKAQILRDMEEK